MSKINIKPLSVNRCWQGRRFKTPEYRAYEQAVWLLLPNRNIPSKKLILNLEAGLSSKNADIDNIAKPFIDILQKKYIFNDKMIYKLNLEKVDVKKGEEYIKFEFKKFRINKTLPCG
ncbi:MAG: RusA family crossover junction endodeoxyribonuclease [archaeon]|nr:RusA family crossover junction endodeoxyribonuclease [archaeon]